MLLVTAGLIVAAVAMFLLLGRGDDDDTAPEVSEQTAETAFEAPSELPPIAYAGNANGAYRVFATAEDGGDPVPVLREAGSDPAWSPEGDRLLFVGEVGSGAKRRVGLLAIDSDKNIDPISKGPQIPSRISFRQGTDEVAVQATHQTTSEETAGITSRSAIVSVDLADGGHSRLFDAGGAAYAPAWAPDGERLVVVVGDPGCRSNGICPQRLELIGPDGKVIESLTDSGAAGSPDWSADGKQIVFTWDRGEGPGVFVMDADGGFPVRVSKGKGAVSDPDFDPDGKSVVFSRDCDLFVQPVAGGAATNITDTEGICEITPDWRGNPES